VRGSGFFGRTDKTGVIVFDAAKSDDAGGFVKLQSSKENGDSARIAVLFFLWYDIQQGERVTGFFRAPQR
jgi:hypothetical protein